MIVYETTVVITREELADELDNLIQRKISGAFAQAHPDVWQYEESFFIDSNLEVEVEVYYDEAELRLD